MKIDRLLSIIMLLLNREKCTAQDLADYFEVSVRTIYRDIDTLCVAGIPVISYQGAGGGFSLMSNFKLDRQVFKPDELLLLITGLQGVETALKNRTVSDALEKVKALTSHVSSGMQKMKIDFSGWDGNGLIRETVGMLYRAIDQFLLVAFSYANLNGERTQRTVEPYRLIFRSAAWYLLGYCRLREDFRFFKVSRIRRLELLTKTFDPREVVYDQNALDDNWQAKNRVQLTLRFSGWGAVRAREWFFPDSIEEIEGERIVVRVAYPMDEWVYSFLLGFGDSLEVLEPSHVRGELIRRSTLFLERNAALGPVPPESG